MSENNREVYNNVYGSTFNLLYANKDVIAIYPEFPGSPLALTKEDLIRMLSVLVKGEPILDEGERIPKTYEVRIAIGNEHYLSQLNIN
jgi:hypothetical protein